MSRNDDAMRLMLSSSISGMLDTICFAQVEFCKDCERIGANCSRHTRVLRALSLLDVCGTFDPEGRVYCGFCESSTDTPGDDGWLLVKNPESGVDYSFACFNCQTKRKVRA